MTIVNRVLRALDDWQRRHRFAAVAYGVVRKFGDDEANLYVVALGWYGFTAIYPLLLVVVTVFGFIGVSSLGHGVVNTLHQFPVIGTEFNPGSGGSNLHGSPFALVVGVAGLLYGAQGVTQTAQRAMAEVWNVPRVAFSGFVPRLLRSLGGLLIIAFSFVANAFVDTFATSDGRHWSIRIVVLLAMTLVNVGLYLAAFRTLTPNVSSWRTLLPGAIAAGIAFTALTTVGSGLMQHQLRNSTNTYGAFASVIGVVAYLLLLAKITLYSAELNPVLARRLWPRALPTRPPTEADDQTLRDLAHAERRRPDQRIGVGFDPDAPGEAADDVATTAKLMNDASSNDASTNDASPNVVRKGN
jgi:uncharacterized BrkB/YihY/UPF0761 family membrane protein